MRLTPSDPDVATIAARIRNGDMNLQPDFQRSEVWGEAKKQRLIDSILRDWHVPPIHVIEIQDSAIQDVLDGQQRLAAIRDFINGGVVIDGHIDPLDAGISRLDGLTYQELPGNWRRKFDQFTIRIFRITDYAPEEPGELFFRLNQQVVLTAAEQRNAFFSVARQQIRDLVAVLESNGICKEFIGFSNSRMAYDDVLARLCLSLEVGWHSEKVTAGALAGKYRSNAAFSSNVVGQVKSAIELLGAAKSDIDTRIRLNKATFYSWLLFIVSATNQLCLTDATVLGQFMSFFERIREQVRASDAQPPIGSELTPGLIASYNDKSSSRVSDVLSVTTRDIVLWALFATFVNRRCGLGIEDCERLRLLTRLLKTEASAEGLIEQLMQIHHWGHKE